MCEILYIEIYRIDCTSDKSDLMYLDVEIEVPGAQNLSRLLVENLDVFFGGTSSLETWINLQLCQAQGFHWINKPTFFTHVVGTWFLQMILTSPDDHGNTRNHQKPPKFGVRPMVSVDFPLELVLKPRSW